MEIQVYSQDYSLLAQDALLQVGIDLLSPVEEQQTPLFYQLEVPLLWTDACISVTPSHVTLAPIADFSHSVVLSSRDLTSVAFDLTSFDCYGTCGALTTALTTSDAAIDSLVALSGNAITVSGGDVSLFGEYSLTLASAFELCPQLSATQVV